MAREHIVVRRKALRKYETFVIRDIRVLEKKYYVTSTELNEVFANCVGYAQSVNKVTVAKPERTILEIIIDRLKALANLFIKLINFMTCGRGPQLFDRATARERVTVFDAVNTEAGRIQQFLQQFVEQVEKDDEEEAVASVASPGGR